MVYNDQFRPVHPFPARMAPSIALGQLAPAKKRPLTVLDPMAGSGTTLVVARSRGHKAIGFDTDPLARLISKVWCGDMSPDRTRRIAGDVLESAKRRASRMAFRNAYPAKSDEETKEFIRFWFNRTNRCELRALADAIGDVARAADRNALWCAFSRLIIAKSRGASLAMDLSHSRPHKVADKDTISPLDEFLRAVDTVLKHGAFAADSQTLPQVSVRAADARRLPIDDGSVDVVITSPPYLNAIDYLRCNKFSLVWMGHRIADLRDLRSRNVGTEVGSKAPELHPLWPIALKAGSIRQLPARDRAKLVHYAQDMDKVLSEISRVLTPRGKCILVIGDCTMRGRFIRNSVLLQSLGARHGLETTATESRPLPPSRRYLPPPCSRHAGENFQTRMREEIVLVMERS